jgi:predicted Rossmann fold nucleotide-binding protein DprA/Smf involved in DNA uptake
MPMIDMEIFFEEFSSVSHQRTPFADGDIPGRSGAGTGLPLEGAERVIACLLEDNENMTIDNLAGEAKMSAAEVFKIVNMMSLRGLVFPSGAGRYGLRN